ncbi:unnamed protein product [Ambrosiozyma monospora]|uniref:Unnamed protein product n=1 Tax=Ambrosiozyma monospora TaxID=43982 RepID=A0ACB5U5R9_AMBMO|nr:unnamed protein product [Ambrosiozyma monospora]
MLMASVGKIVGRSNEIFCQGSHFRFVDVSGYLAVLARDVNNGCELYASQDVVPRQPNDDGLKSNRASIVSNGNNRVLSMIASSSTTTPSFSSEYTNRNSMTTAATTTTMGTTTTTTTTTNDPFADQPTSSIAEIANTQLLFALAPSFPISIDSSTPTTTGTTFTTTTTSTTISSSGGKSTTDSLLKLYPSKNQSLEPQPCSHILIDFKSIQGSVNLIPRGFTNMSAIFYLRDAKRQLSECYCVDFGSAVSGDGIDFDALSAALFTNVPLANGGGTNAYGLVQGPEKGKKGKVFLVCVVCETIELRDDNDKDTSDEESGDEDEKIGEEEKFDDDDDDDDDESDFDFGFEKLKTDSAYNSPIEGSFGYVSTTSPNSPSKKEIDEYNNNLDNQQRDVGNSNNPTISPPMLHHQC